MRPTPHWTPKGCAWEPWARMADQRRRGTRVSPSACRPDPGAWIGRALRLLDIRRSTRMVDGGCPAPAPGTHGRPDTVPPPSCSGRDEGTERFQGRREPRRALGTHHDTGDGASIRVWCRHGVWPSRSQSSQNTRPEAHGAGPQTAEKFSLTGLVCLLTTGGLISVRRTFSRHCKLSK